MEQKAYGHDPTLSQFIAGGNRAFGCAQRAARRLRAGSVSGIMRIRFHNPFAAQTAALRRRAWRAADQEIAMSACPCGSGQELQSCCGPILEGASAPTPEALMRARYTAHVLGNFEFLEKSLHSGTRENVDKAKLRKWSEMVSWQGLEVLGAEGGGPEDDKGRVSFVARYSVGETPQEIREDAEFVRENGEWRYLDGQVHGHTPYRREAPKVGRNDPCPCGSGKKYKKCCGA
jgi:SEC-C motif-containing protein